MTLGYRELLFAEIPAGFKKLAKSIRLQVPLPGPKAQPPGSKGPLAYVLQDPEFNKGSAAEKPSKSHRASPSYRRMNHPAVLL